ncbi:MAG: exodeoxyribonuclease VII large subunit [Rhodospirillaceae bacterium]|nr:exodeoxyribonuclease VII large subunit [Rhodospirillaceae bacterium]
MSSVFEEFSLSSKQYEYSVSEISHKLRHTIEQTYAIVSVRGEISGFKSHPNGYLFFSIKDSKAKLEVVCWKNTISQLLNFPENGKEMVVTGHITTYPSWSRYQLVAEQLVDVGLGRLFEQLEKLKKRFLDEGLFDKDRKKKIPFLPEVIGVITSLNGAVFHDIMDRLKDRFPRLVLVWSVEVQGKKATKQVAEAINGFNKIKIGNNIPRPDLLIVARGGGSLEDLWAFNEDVVVRAAANSNIPLISAIGHETDSTLIDFVADLRAPTPTAAAEKAVPVRSELVSQINEENYRLIRAFKCLFNERQNLLDSHFERLTKAFPNNLMYYRANFIQISERLKHPREQIAQYCSIIERNAMRLDVALSRSIDNYSNDVKRISSLLYSFSYEQVLKRGFVLVHSINGKSVTMAETLHPKDHLVLTFHGQKTVHVSVNNDQGN